MPPPFPPRDPRHIAHLMLGLIPEDVRKQLSNAELNDRLTEAARLSTQANDPALSVDLRQAARIRSQAILKAQPRATTERQHREMVAKAAAMPPGFRANMVAEHARQLLEDHPIAPRGGAAVAKAKAAEKDPPIPVFDDAGNLIGICDADDIQPVASSGKQQAPAPAPAPPASDDQGAATPAAPVAKSGQVIVYDQWKRPYVTRRGSIRMGISPVWKAAAEVYDAAGRVVGTLTPEGKFTPASPEVQARNTGPVQAGGTTGMGQPRKTGPAASSPANGPQAARPGDVPGRTVIKTMGEVRREQRLERIEKVTGQDLTRPHMYARNPYSDDGNCVCEAPAVHRTHTALAPGYPLDPRRIAKSAWAPAWSNLATERWLAAQRRR